MLSQLKADMLFPIQSLLSIFLSLDDAYVISIEAFQKEKPAKRLELPSIKVNRQVSRLTQRPRISKSDTVQTAGIRPPAKILLEK